MSSRAWLQTGTEVLVTGGHEAYSARANYAARRCAAIRPGATAQPHRADPSGSTRATPTTIWYSSSPPEPTAPMGAWSVRNSPPSMGLIPIYTALEKITRRLVVYTSFRYLPRIHTDRSESTCYLTEERSPLSSLFFQLRPAAKLKLPLSQNIDLTNRSFGTSRL